MGRRGTLRHAAAGDGGLPGTGAGLDARVLLGRPRRPRDPGRAAARGLVALQVVIALIPVLVIGAWAFAAAWPWPSLAPRALTTRGAELVLSGSQGAGLPLVLRSVGLSMAAAALSTLCAALAARAVCCHGAWRPRHLVHFAALLPFVIPSTVFAMGVQVLFLRMGLARTVPGVVLAHAVACLPYAMAIMVEVTGAAGTRLEDAARTSGAGWPAVLRHVTLPSLAPGLVGALSMSFVVSMSQYFLTLLVGGGAVRTFALVLFPYLSGGDRTVAGAYGLAFILVTTAVFLVFELLLRRMRSLRSRELYGS